MKLGINVDHVATLRESRKTIYPDPVLAAQMCELAGCDLITCHLREDRRHINEKDIYRLKDCVETELNMEISTNPGIVAIALKSAPDKVTLVPEKRKELTTEGGLNVIWMKKEIKKLVTKFHQKNIRVSLFIEPDLTQIDSSADTNADEIELHTGKYSNSKGSVQETELNRIKNAANYGVSKGLIVAAGHGLHYHNTADIARIQTITELNIGHAIIARAIFTGISNAVREMREIIANSRIVGL